LRDWTAAFVMASVATAPVSELSARPAGAAGALRSILTVEVWIASRFPAASVAWYWIVKVALAPLATVCGSWSGHVAADVHAVEVPERQRRLDTPLVASEGLSVRTTGEVLYHPAVFGAVSVVAVVTGETVSTFTE
jgi:hypothetical protein